MTERIVYLETDSTDPYDNLALEEALLEEAAPGKCILYLWQNQNTVVIGRNQNCWKECAVEELEQSGGHLARRLSGGGAVYHDLGNLNFTFLASKEDYHLGKQMEVIQRAVRAFGLNAQKNGRNDLTLDGKKFSGNAFYEAKGKCYHHGTILISADKEKAARFLNVDMQKLKSKGVEFVRSRIENLQTYCRDVTVENMKQSLIYAFSLIYGCCPQRMTQEELPRRRIEELERKYRSWEWTYGRKIPFTHTFSRRFSWGDFELQLQVEAGRIENVNVFSDSLDSHIYRLGENLRGIKYGKAEILQALEAGMEKAGVFQECRRDIIGLLEAQMW